MATKSIIAEYLSQFQVLIGRTEVTDKHGKKFSFDAGVSEAIAVVRGVKSSRRKIMFVGNGGSAGIVSHLAVDYWKMGGMRSMVFSDPAFLTCIANDDGYPHVYEKPIETFVRQRRLPHGHLEFRTIGKHIARLEGRGKRRSQGHYAFRF